MSYLSEEKKLLESYNHGALKEDTFSNLIAKFMDENGDFRVSKHLTSSNLDELQFEHAICYEISLVAIHNDEIQIWFDLIKAFMTGKNTVKSLNKEQKALEVIDPLDRDIVEDQYNSGLNHEDNMILISNRGSIEDKTNPISVYETFVKVDEKDIVFCFSNAAATLYIITFDNAYSDFEYFASKLPGEIISYQLFIKNDDWVYVTAEDC